MVVVGAAGGDGGGDSLGLIGSAVAAMSRLLAAFSGSRVPSRIVRESGQA